VPRPRPRSNRPQVLLDVAHSLSYLHRINLLHGDVKLENVLLKSEPTRPFGVVPKVGAPCVDTAAGRRAAPWLACAPALPRAPCHAPAC
jgi:serine/threonine protein kinase